MWDAIQDVNDARDPAELQQAALQKRERAKGARPAHWEGGERSAQGDAKRCTKGGDVSAEHLKKLHFPDLVTGTKGKRKANPNPNTTAKKASQV